MSNKTLYSKEILQAPLGGGSAARSIEINTSRIIQAGFKLGKFGLLQYASKRGVQTYNSLKGEIKGAQVHHLIE